MKYYYLCFKKEALIVQETFLNWYVNVAKKYFNLYFVILSKLSNQNHATSFVTKSVGANGFSYFLFLMFCTKT